MSSLHAQIADWLGIPPQANDAEIVGIVERQLSPRVIQRLRSGGLERSEIDATIIPSRTLQHRRSRREKLTVEESDRVLRAVRVIARTETIYGDRPRALAWLRRPNPRLEGRTPLSLLTTDAGVRTVEDLLIQTEEGMFI